MSLHQRAALLVLLACSGAEAPESVDEFSGDDAGGESGGRYEIAIEDFSQVIPGEDVSQSFGAYVDASTDIDCDSVDDLLVGAIGFSEVESLGGAAYLLTHVEGEDAQFELNRFLVGDDPGAFVGYAMAPAPDFGGDGERDVIVGAPRFNYKEGQGAICVVTAPKSSQQHLTECSMLFLGEEPGGLLGWSVSPARDVTGDDIDDLLVGAPGNGASSTPGGAAVVFSGAALGSGQFEDPAYLVGAHPGDAAGWAVAAGDLSGDGVAEVAVTAPQESSAGLFSGALYVSEGPVVEPESLASAQIWLGESGDQLGWSLEIPGDLDGDGYEDLLVGAPGQNMGEQDGGAVYFLRGGVTMVSELDEADGKFIGAVPGGGLGTSLAAGEDLDGDGQPDLLIGAQFEGGWEDRSGAVYLFSGPPEPTQTTLEAAAKITSSAEVYDLGEAISAGDIDGDGAADITLGTPDTRGTDYTGAVWLLLGGEGR
jgi:hypothetical protein